MISIIKADGTSEVRQLEAMRARAAQKNADIELAVSAVMQNVKENGLSAVRDYSRQFDHREPYELTRAQLEEAYRSCPAELIAALEAVRGVGVKVANCVALFAYGRTACAPVDTWIKKVIQKEYQGQNPFARYGNAAGIMQQYFFYYAQSHKAETA